MEQYALSINQKRALKEYGEEFQKWKETENGQKEMQAHREHENYFKLKLTSENLSKLTKVELTEIYKEFWASKFWSNKDWKINKIIDANGLDNLKKELHLLLYGNDVFEKCYDSFRKKIKGFGISAISELLNMLFPDKFCLWNNVTKTVLNFLKLKDSLPESVFKYNYISGEEYSECIKHISTIKKEISNYGINDFVELDMFFWYIHENIIAKDWKLSSQLEYDKEEKNVLQERKNIIDLENLIIGASLDNDYTREKERFPYSSKGYIPDFVFFQINTIVEVKFCDSDSKLKEIISEINDDIVAYKTKYENMVFVYMI